MKTYATFLGLIISSTLLFAQKTVDISDFNSLKVYDKIPVELVKSSENKVEISGSMSDNIAVEQKNKEVKIKMTGTDLLQGDNVKVLVYYSDVNYLQASQGASIKSSETLKTTNLELTSNEGSTIKLSLNVENLEVKLNSGGNMMLDGNTTNQSIVVNTGGQYEAKSLISNNSTVTCNAGGHAWINASDKVDAKVRAGGVIEVYGNPDDKKQKKIAGGSIKFM